ncbi:MAG: hypothetical protein JNM76_07885 [Betaproteobacteria bacterium]|nr:hypothetical protein [Betaproteobacteria bacterium]
MLGFNPDTGLGTISVRDASGMLRHDGTNTDLYNAEMGGVAAVIIAPGPPIQRWQDASGSVRVFQDRGCTGPGCDADGSCKPPATSVAACNPVNYLEKAWGLGGDEDNADFIDRNDSRGGNGNGFISGPISAPDGTIYLNDELVVITYSEIMLVIMNKVALEVANCMESYAAKSNNWGRYPYPAPICRSGAMVSNQWSDRDQILFGRVPDPPFDTTRPDSMDTMDDTWNSSTALGCTLGSSATVDEWWDGWKSHVFVAIAENYKPGSSPPPACTATSCLQVVDRSGNLVAQNKRLAILVSSAALSGVSPSQSRSSLPSSDARLARNYLELTNKDLELLNNLGPISECADMAPHPPPCSPLSLCNKITVNKASADFNDVVIYFPR